MSRKPWLFHVLALLAVVSALLTIATFGSVSVLRPFSPVELEGPKTVDSNGTVTAIADSESRRLLILNESDELAAVVRFSSLNTSVEAVTKVCVSGSKVYVAGAVYQGEGGTIAKERVLLYDANGTFVKKLYEVPKVVGFAPTIRSLNATEDGFVAGIMSYGAGDDYLKSSLTFVRVHDDGRSETVLTKEMGGDFVASGGYSAKSDTFALSTIQGKLVSSKGALPAELANHVLSSTDVDDLGNIYVYDESTGSIHVVSPDGKATKLVDGGDVDDISATGEHVSFCSSAQNEVEVNAGGEVWRTILEVRPSIGLSAFMLLIVASRVYLAAFVLVFALMRIVALVRSGEAHNLGALLGSATVVLAVGIAVGYSSYQSRQESIDTRLKTVNSYADYLQTSLGTLDEAGAARPSREVLREGINLESDEHESAANTYDRLAKNVSLLVDSATRNDVGLYANIYAYDARGVFYLYDSSAEHVFGASIDSERSLDIVPLFTITPSDAEALGMREGATRSDVTRYRVVPLFTNDRDSVFVVVEIGVRMLSFGSYLLSGLAERVASLLVMMAILYLVYIELRRCGRCLLDYRGFQGEQSRDALALLTRPFTFCVTALSSIDSVMTVLIAKQLVETLGSDQPSVMVAIPSVMLGVGLVLGHLLYGFVGSRVTPRRLVTVGMVAVAAFAGMAILSVVSVGFWLYCAAKMLLAIPLGTLYSFGYSLPRRAESDEVRALASAGVTETDTSAAAIGTVLGGYAAQMLGTVWVYVLIVVTSMLMVLFVRSIFPKGMAPLEQRHRRSLGQVAGFLFSPSVVALTLLIMLPSILATGYDSFLFPIFSSGLGMSTAGIHNVSAFGKLIVFVCIPLVNRAGERLDKWGLAWTTVALMGPTFLLFSFNTTVAWAIIVIALIGVLVKGSNAWKALWIRTAGAQRFPRGTTTGMMFAVRSVLLMVQPLILTYLLSTGDRTAVFALGIICLACGVLFWLTTRRGDLAPQE